MATAGAACGEASGDASAVQAWVGLGANLGDAVTTLRAAMAEIAGLDGTRLLAQSSLYRSAPIDASGPDFINAVVQLVTRLSARELLSKLQAIERRHGRARPYRNAPRTLDLDLLLYGDTIIATPELELPHPRMVERAFVLVPLAEISPRIEIPGAGPLAGLLAGVAGSIARATDRRGRDAGPLTLAASRTAWRPRIDASLGADCRYVARRAIHSQRPGWRQGAHERHFPGRRHALWQALAA